MIGIQKVLYYVLIPTHNRKELLHQLLDNLSNQIIPEKYELKIVVINDGSKDGTEKMIGDHFPHVHVIQGDGSWWFTRCINEGLVYITNRSPDFVLILNDDLEVARDYLSTLIDNYSNTDHPSILGSTTVSIASPGKIFFSGIKKIIWWRNKSIPYHKLFQTYRKEELKGIVKSKVVPARGMLIPREVIEIVGLFDGKFKQYKSDYEFCLRAQKLGINVYVSWDSLVYSHIQVSDNSSSFLKASFGQFITSFFSPYSRNYLKDIFRYLYRHGNRLLIPLTVLITILSSFKNHIKPKHY